MAETRFIVTEGREISTEIQFYLLIQPTQKRIYAQIQTILSSTDIIITAKNQKIITILNENIDYIDPQWVFNASSTATSIPLAHLLVRLEYKYDQWKKLIDTFSKRYKKAIIQVFTNQVDATQQTILSNENIGSDIAELLIAHGADPFLGENRKCAFLKELRVINTNMDTISCMLTSITKNKTVYKSAKKFFQYRDINGNNLLQHLLNVNSKLFLTIYDLLIGLKTSITEAKISGLLNFSNPNNNKDSIYHLLAASPIEITLLEHEKVLAQSLQDMRNNQGQTPLFIARMSENLLQFSQMIGIAPSDTLPTITRPSNKSPKTTVVTGPSSNCPSPILSNPWRNRLKITGPTLAGKKLSSNESSPDKNAPDDGVSSPRRP